MGGDRIHPIRGYEAHSPPSASAPPVSGEIPATTALNVDMAEQREPHREKEEETQQLWSRRDKEEDTEQHSSHYDKEHERNLLDQLPKDYIYTFPEPLPLDHPSHRSRPRRRRCSPWCRCFAWCVGILVTILFALGITALVLYLVLQPKAPNFSVTDASTSTFTVSTQPSQLAPTSGAFVYLNADVTFTVQTENPNKRIGIYYDAVDVTLFYNGTQIGNGSIPAFYQGHRNTTQLQLEMEGKDVPLSQPVGQALQIAVINKSNLSLQVITIARVRVRVGSWKSKASTFEVKCDVQISNPVAGDVQLISRSCKLEVKSFNL